MLENIEHKSSFLHSSAIKLGKSRRYSILRNDCEIDGFSAVKLFVEDGIDYNHFAPATKVLFPKKNNKIFKNLEVSSRIFCINIGKFIEYTNLTLEEFCVQFQIEYKKVALLLGRGDSFPLSTCLLLEKMTNVCLPLWFSTSVDIEILALNWALKNTHRVVIPNGYLQAAGSKVRLLESSILFIDNELGVSCSNFILAYLQIDRSIFFYPDRNISILVFRKLHQALRMYGCNDQFFIDMGQYNITSNKLTKIDLSQRTSAKSTKEVFLELGTTLCPRVDKNFDYEVSFINDDKIIIFSKPKDLMKNLLGDIVGGHEVALYRFGHMLQVPSYFEHAAACEQRSYLVYDETDDTAYFHYYF